MLSLLSFICALQFLLLVVIFSLAKTCQLIKFDFKLMKPFNWNIFSTYSNFYWIPCHWGVVGSFIYNEDESQKIRAIQPVEKVVFAWGWVRVIANIEYKIYWNDTKKKSQ